MRMRAHLLSLLALMGILLLPEHVWACLNNPLWQDTLRCRLYPTQAQTPPPAPAPPSHVNQLQNFTRVELPMFNSIGQPMRCLDGTSPIIYVDPAEGDEPSNNWVITFQGGGSCSNPQSCLDAYMDPREEGEMGSAKQPAMKNLAGIHSTLTANKFRFFNRVKVHKCGYDRYNGAAIARNVTAIVDTDWDQDGIPGEAVNSPLSAGFDPNQKSVREGSSYTFDLFHQGQQHVLHVLDELMDGLAYQTWINVDDNVTTAQGDLPPLKDAERILFAGHSGAAHGLMHNIDNLSTHMIDWSLNNGFDFKADVRALFDAHLLPSNESEIAFVGSQRFDIYDQKTICEVPCFGPPPLNYNYNGRDYYSSGGAGGLGYFDGPHQEWNTQLDASCLAAHAADPWRCNDRWHVLYNHITTPFMIREDFRDPNGQHNNNPAGPENFGHRLFWATPELGHCSDPMATEPCLPVLSEADFRARIEEQAERFKVDFSTRSELALTQTPIPTVFLWLPDCAEHSGAFDTTRFLKDRMKSAKYQQNANMHDFLIKFMRASTTGEFDSRIDSDEDWESVCR